MTLVDQYLRRLHHAVPTARGDEAVTEIRLAIEEHLQRECDTVGHALNEEEVRSALRRFGSPWEVGALYWKRSWFIPGPLIRPYFQTLVCSLIAVTTVHGALIVHRAIEAGSLGNGISQSIPGLLLAFSAVAVVPTMAFALLGQRVSRANLTV